jgi:ABC-type transport system involved in cytochrome bd biosynthesis fused ATPase/permease subunit
MKYSIPAKFFAILLTALALAVAVVSAMGIAHAVLEDLYTQSPEEGSRKRVGESANDFAIEVRERTAIQQHSNATEEELSQAIHVSAMDDFLDQLPQGLETRLGENAAGLSEGQAQRLSIARAVLGGAPILLLDECTSALDARTEQLVLQRLRQLPDRTCIAVTHRPAAVELCDWRLEVSGGGIQAVENR